MSANKNTVSPISEGNSKPPTITISPNSYTITKNTHLYPPFIQANLYPMLIFLPKITNPNMIGPPPSDKISNIITALKMSIIIIAIKMSKTILPKIS